MGLSARILERSPIFGPNRAFKAGGGSGGPSIVRGSINRIYKVLRTFAQGGMSDLYQVQDGSGGIHLLKTLKDLSDYDPATQVDIQKRFRREARILHAIHHTDLLPAEFAQHRNKIVKLLDWDPAWNPAEPQKVLPRYYIMEKIAGHDLETVVKNHQLVDPLHATTIIYSMMLGLVVFGEVAKRLGEGTFAHRDLKPANIMLEMLGSHVNRVVLMDFGIAHLANEYDEKLTQTGAFWGTPEYTAPEVYPANSKAADMRSDVFAAGFMYYELLTGQAPFNPQDPAQVRLFYSNPQSFVDRLAVECQKTGRVHVNVRNILFRALAAHPDRRYQSYGEFASVLWDLTQRLQRA